MNPRDEKERRVAWAMLILCPFSMFLMFIYVTMGYAGGLAAGHPEEYLQATCFLWAIVMTVLPILRLARIIALPYWFLVLVYANMYMYVISLCEGFYFNLDWWANFTHVISTMVVAAIIFLALCAMETHSPSHVSLGTKGGIAAVMLMGAFSFGAIWEVMEGFTDILTGIDYMSYGALHTMGNLAADMLGAIIMTAIALIMLSRRDVTEIASGLRLGKNNIDVVEVSEKG